MKIQRIVTLLCTAALLLCAASPPALAADRSAACYYPVEVELMWYKKSRHLQLTEKE